MTLASIGSIVAACSASAAINLNVELDGATLRLQMTGAAHVAPDTAFVVGEDTSYVSLSTPRVLVQATTDPTGNSSRVEVFVVAGAEPSAPNRDPNTIDLGTADAIAHGDGVFYFVFDIQDNGATVSVNPGAFEYDAALGVITFNELVDFNYGTEEAAAAKLADLETLFGADYTIMQGDDVFMRVTFDAIPEPLEWGIGFGCVGIAATLLRRRQRLRNSMTGPVV